MRIKHTTLESIDTSGKYSFYEPDTSVQPPKFVEIERSFERPDRLDRLFEPVFWGFMVVLLGWALVFYPIGRLAMWLYSHKKEKQ